MTCAARKWRLMGAVFFGLSMSAWLLPESVADVLPSDARRVEELRRRVLDCFRRYGYELVMPPLLEYAESLFSGTGQGLDLKTFKLIDQASGRTLCVRADTTPQVARIDAHILNRRGVTRLCYCGPVLHTRTDALHATRDPLQCGAELFGHDGVEADIEILRLAVDALHMAGLSGVCIDLTHADLLPALLADVPGAAALASRLHGPLSRKDRAAVHVLLNDVPASAAAAVLALLDLYGFPGDGTPAADGGVLQRARAVLPDTPRVRAALDTLQTLCDALKRAGRGVTAMVDLADFRGYDYHSGVMFAAYATGSPDAVLRGGRYDNVGEVFGRRRAATGFSFDLKALTELVAATHQRTRAIRAPWAVDAALDDCIRQLRDAGEIVVQSLPGHGQEEEEFEFDRELKASGQGWSLVSVSAGEKQ